MRTIQLALIAGVVVTVIAAGYLATASQPNASTAGSVSTSTVTCGTGAISGAPCSGLVSTSTSCTLTSQVRTTSTNGSAVFEMGHMQANFSVGGYQFTTLYNGTGYSSAKSGTETINHGFTILFNVTRGTQAQLVMFGTAPPTPFAPGNIPSPSDSTIFNGSVQLKWVATCASIFLEINTAT